MNAPFGSRNDPARVLMHADDFWMLKQSGAFDRYIKSELLEGELWGCPRAENEREQSDAVFPIKLRVEDYERLDRTGALQKYGRTELINGAIYRMSPQHRPHGFAKDELAYRLRRKLEELGSSLRVATEQSVLLSPHSEPQPDIILTTEPRGKGAIPGASVALIVEVPVTTLEFDLGEKADLYAAAGVPEYWVVDLNENRVLLHANPRSDGSGYDGQLDVLFGEPLHAATVEGLLVDTTGLD